MYPDSPFKLEDTTKYLWDYLYACKIPQLSLLTENEIRVQGLPTTGDRGIDKELNNQLIDVMIPIYKMVEYHSEGHPIRLTKHTDAKIIYDHVQSHLEAWATMMKRSVNLNQAPIAELLAMNNFANSIFQHAKDFFDVDDPGSDFMRYIDSLSYNRNRTAMDDPTERAERKQNLGRTDYDDLFKNINVGGYNPWN